ncbi:MAG: methyltransferase domain-containing protein [Mariprofundaceae bacterium]|nr:methyltransferase domain-containing protein [Mariprofundaceae bacterium]
MKKDSIPYISFYEDLGIIPVHQDLTQLDVHFERRSALYRHLGLIPSFVRGMRVIEFGPGTGDNAVHTASFGPSRYVFVDGNTSSVKVLEEKISKNILPKNATVCFENANDYTDDEKYDLVICEGIVPGQCDPSAFLKKLSSFVDVGGVIFLTTQSSTSLLSENCRRAMKPFLTRPQEDVASLIERSAVVFQSHLETLPGTTRNAEDWVLDNIVHPWNPEFVFTIADAIEALDGEFEVLGASPNFLSDWRWYKSIVGEDTGTNRQATEQYYKYAAAMIDYRSDPEASLDVDGEQLESLCRLHFEKQIEICENNDRDAIIRETLPLIEDIIMLIEAALPDTASALQDYIVGMQALSAGNEVPDVGRFAALFGRGQQYLSMSRIRK